MSRIGVESPASAKMPIEVVDLLSSPSPPPPVSAISKTAPTKPLTHEPSKNRPNGLFNSLPDDAFSRLASTSPNSTKPAFSLNANKSAAQSTVNRKSEDDFWVLSDDSDAGILPVDPFSKPAVIAKDKLKPASRLSRGNNKRGDKDFYFLDDDFDSTVHLDDPFAELPPAKKRRMSSSPPDRTSKLVLQKKAAGYGRSLSNIEPRSHARKYAAPRECGVQKFKNAAILESDPIVFTSSPDPFADLTKRRKEKRRKESFDEDNDDGFGGNATKDLIGDGAGLKFGKVDIIDDLWDSDLDLPDIGSVPVKPAAKKSQKSSQTALAKYNDSKAAEKKAKERAQKAEDKLAEKERKRLAREEKTREKERAANVAKANTVRTDKKVSTPEMIVDLPSCLEPRLSEQIRTFLERVDVENSEYGSQIPLVKWRRKVTTVYNNDLCHWEPMALNIKSEKHILYIMPAQEFADLATNDKGIDAHVQELKTKFESSTIIYLIEGLNPWMRKNKNVKNRQFTAAVRGEAGLDEVASSQGNKRKKKKVPEYVDANMIEDALLRLQVIHRVLIHHSNVLVETAQWVLAFTQHISTIPYKAQKDTLNTAFCMDSGQVKTGDSPEDTYVKMLQEIMRITAAVAYGIAAEYPTVQKLVKGLEEVGPLALEDVRKSANKDGAFTDRRVGQAISRRVYRVFTGRDEEGLDV